MSAAIDVLLSCRRRANEFAQLVALRRQGLLISPSCQLQLDAPSTLVFGTGCSIGRGSMIAVLAAFDGSPATLRLGDDVSIGELANIRATASVVEIGSGTIFAQFVSVVGANHELDAEGRPMRDVTDRERSGVKLGAGCWLGTHAVVLPGVELGDHCIVGAGAVVTKSFPAGSRLVGSPARAI